MEPLPSKAPSQRRKAMILSSSIVLLCGLGFVIYWWFWWRFEEYTNDAYVNGNKVYLTPQVAGIVTSFSAMDTDYVLEGRILVELDQTDATIALDKSLAELGTAVRDVCQLFERVRDLSSQIEKKKALLLQAAQDFEHRQALIAEGAVSKEDLEHAIAALSASFADLLATEHAYVGALSAVDGTTLENHPLVIAAEEKVREAYVSLQRCTLLAPVSGIVAQRTVQVGKQVYPGDPLLAIVPLDQMWIDANYKEVQLTHVRIGQPVQVVSDIWGREMIFHGKVVGIGGGTGSIFSVLPPQNATGNWIKIVQRLPVKIALDPEEVKEFPLRLGLSVETTIDIHDTKKAMIPPTPPDQPLYETSVLSHQEEGVEELITETILENLSPTFIEDMESKR